VESIYQKHDSKIKELLSQDRTARWVAINIAAEHDYKPESVRQYITRRIAEGTFCTNKAKNKPKEQPDLEAKEYNPIDDVAVRRLKAALADTTAKLRITQAKLDDTSNALDQALFLQAHSQITVPAIIQDDPSINEACAIIDWSDWHVEERVERGTTNGLNEYNPDIAEYRSKRLASNTVKLIRKEQQNVRINKLLIVLGGDFINNYLHEHDLNSNYLSPIEASAFAKRLLKQAILTVADHAKVRDVTIMCIRGNHGRLTKKMQTNNDYRMNHEAMIYALLKQEMVNCDFQWVIPESGIGEVDVFAHRIRAIHGHEFKYAGGIGGLSIPAIKFVQRLDQTVKCSFTLIHHYHTCMMIGNNINVNGSMVGTNSYSVGLGMKHEPPTQTFQLLDARRGFTVRCPIWCE
jgi:hypothetical protein